MNKFFFDTDEFPVVTDHVKHAAQVAKVDNNDWMRAGGECICTVCGKEYSRHPNCEGKLYWLTELCNGTLVKL